MHMAEAGAIMAVRMKRKTKSRPRDGRFPVVGIGASAGGLEAFTQVLEHMPTDTGMAFVVIQHLAPKHKSMLTDLLARATRMKVAEAADGMRIRPDRVYVIPPNMNLSLDRRVLRLHPRDERRMPIDYFFRSMAEQLGPRAIGIILSGTASDGVLGLEAIKSEGGFTIAQAESSAKYAGMPHAAIAAGCVDMILPPEMIGTELARIGRHPHIRLDETASEEGDRQPLSDPEALTKLFTMLRVATGVDFTYYKQTTIKRRLTRRMALQKIERLQDYLKFVQQNPPELEHLFQDMLIKTTHFFRDLGAFLILKNKVFPALLKSRSPEVPIRIWVPGCSTGEEVYSIAIVLLETLGDVATQVPCQFFATDVSERAVEKARSGVYSASIAQDVSPERLRRFFIKVNGDYQISKLIRDMCVFARQNLFKDPPFSKLDLISCRNLLIYLEPVLQKKIISTFHYSLKANGYLMLGSSESISTHPTLFSQIDKKQKIFAKKASTTAVTVDFGREHVVEPPAAKDSRLEPSWTELDLQKEADRIVLSSFSPSGVLVNGDFEIIQFRGQISPFLAPAPGKASLNLLKMAREGLLFDLRTTLLQAKKNGVRARRDGVFLKQDGRARTVSIEVVPIKAPAGGPYFLVLFGETAPPAESKLKKETSGSGKAKSREKLEMQRLAQELATTKEHLQSIIQEQEATNEELQTANEEVVSSNEELQSTNEELETAKEELQSTNEELTTLNEELQNRNTELTQLNNDLTNLLGSVNLPIVMLGSDLRIRRFTPMAEKTLNLIATDVGRPISDLNLTLQNSNLPKLLEEVVDEVASKDIEVQDKSGRWYSMRLRPYRTRDNKIDGAVIVLVDIDPAKTFALELQGLKEFSEAIVNTVRHPIVVLSGELKIQQANPAFYRAFQLTREECAGRHFYEVGEGRLSLPSLRRLLESILPTNSVMEDFVWSEEIPKLGRRHYTLNARRMKFSGPHEPMILLALEPRSGPAAGVQP